MSERRPTDSPTTRRFDLWILMWVALAFTLACGPRSPLDGGSPLSFTDEGATIQSGYEGTRPQLQIQRAGDRWLVTVFQGKQPAGGYSIHVERMRTMGTGLLIQARFSTPKGSPFSSALTSPAQTVGIPFGPDEIRLFDQDGQERAVCLVRSASSVYAGGCT